MRPRPSAWPARCRVAWEEEAAFGHPFLFLPLLIALGALLWFSAHDPPDLLNVAVLACVFCIASGALLSRPGWLRLVVLTATGLLLGATSAAFETARTATVMLDSPVTTTMTGKILSREIAGRTAYRYIVALQSTEAPRLRRPPTTLTLVVRNGGAAKVGDVIKGRARLSPPSGPALAGLNDFGFDSFFKGIGAVGYAYGKPQILVEAGNRETDSWSLIDRGWAGLAVWREAIGMRIRATIPGDAGAIAAALVTAEERAIGRDSIAALRNSGLGHVLAISGLNMVLAAGTLLVGLRTGLSLVPGLAHRVPIKKIAAAGALLMVCFYILISGGAVSAVRSWIMIVIMLVAVFFDRPSISLRNVAIAALVILAVDPSAVSGPGFQMSFAATLALVAGYARWREREVPAGRREGNEMFASLRGFLAGLFLSSLIGGVSTMIYSAAHFNQLPAYGLLGNMLAMPVIGIVVMPAGLVAMLLMPLGLDTLPLMVMGYGLEVMLAVARFVSSLGGQIMTGRLPHAAFALIAIGGLVVCLLRTRLALAGLGLAVLGLCMAVAAPSERPALLVAEDGRLVAITGGTAGASNRPRPPAFIYGQWTRALRLERHQAPAMRTDLALPEPPSPTADGRNRPPFERTAARAALRRLIGEGEKSRFSCVPEQWCAATSRQGWVVVTVEDRRLVGAACDLADIVVTSASLAFSTCRSGALLAGARMLRKTGALEIYADETAPQGRRIVTAMDGLVRPWQRHRAYDWRRDTFPDDVPDTDGALTSAGAEES
ncbi:ComEC family competence protein [Rhizobium sp. DKSPLA3]|uniref:ComEC family competence protein n=1 Tax=Rhizobium quercicola TaxID=2901226 RepID=A0A9X1NST7_9HYPH|nr:ComEC/Rec2 family competence protein [Rhizobium quercicola]MCD7110392.1 ComEC family competence protein [Rhizobium quercicola]